LKTKNDENMKLKQKLKEEKEAADLIKKEAELAKQKQEMQKKREATKKKREDAEKWREEQRMNKLREQEE